MQQAPRYGMAPDALAQALVYLACAPKSNAVYKGFNEAMAAAKQTGTQEVPLHLRNAPTRLAKELGHGKGYRYAHNEPGAYAHGKTGACSSKPVLRAERGRVVAQSRRRHRLEMVTVVLF